MPPRFEAHHPANLDGPRWREPQGAPGTRGATGRPAPAARPVQRDPGPPTTTSRRARPSTPCRAGSPTWRSSWSAVEMAARGSSLLRRQWGHRPGRRASRRRHRLYGDCRSPPERPAGLAALALAGPAVRAVHGSAPGRPGREEEGNWPRRHPRHRRPGHRHPADVRGPSGARSPRPAPSRRQERTRSLSHCRGARERCRNELARHGVNVNAVAPGYIETKNTKPLRADVQRASAISARIPAGRWGRPEDITGAVVFLCSSAASYVHG